MEEKVKAMVRDVGCLVETPFDSNTLEELGFDELSKIDLFIQLEEAFNLSLEDDKWDKCESVGDLIELIKKETGGEK
jgi:acyl carrier protein